MKLKYTGLSHERSFVKGDFTRHGLEGDDVGAVKFNAGNNWIAEVPDAVGEWLIENEAPEFREATEEDEVEPDMTRVNSLSRPRGKRSDAAGLTEGSTESDLGEPGPAGKTAKKASASTSKSA